MKCLICNEAAEKVESSLDAILVNCDPCGPYAVSGSAVAEMNHNIYAFNTLRARDWLMAQRNEGNERPMINSHNELWD